MFSQLVWQGFKRIVSGLQPKFRFASPLRLVADLLFALFVFLSLNRRPLSHYGRSFWHQLLYFGYLLKVTYTLRFLLVEIVFREMRTFLCLINPFVKDYAPVLKEWGGTSAVCPLKIINLVFSGIFVFVNVALVLWIENAARKVWKLVWKDKTPAQPTVDEGVCTEEPQPEMQRRRRQKRRRSGRYSVRYRRRVGRGCPTDPCKQTCDVGGKVLWRSDSNSSSERSATNRCRERRACSPPAPNSSPRRTRSGRNF